VEKQLLTLAVRKVSRSSFRRQTSIALIRCGKTLFCIEKFSIHFQHFLIFTDGGRFTQLKKKKKDIANFVIKLNFAD
jgi:hypothetical protein